MSEERPDEVRRIEKASELGWYSMPNGAWANPNHNGVVKRHYNKFLYTTNIDCNRVEWLDGSQFWSETILMCEARLERERKNL